MSKLSNSILSLKFMQNAQRAKQQEEVEIERAKVKDEAEWEVPKEVREGWEEAAGSSAVSLEDSYLPFLYPVLETAGSDASLKGRRRYKNGALVKEEEKLADPSTSTDEADKAITKAEAEDTERASERPRKPRSGASLLNKKKKSAKQEATAGDPHIPGTAKTVQDLIRENAGVGVDLRGARAAPSPPVFLKPSGVDEPSRPSATSAAATTSAATPTVKTEKSSASVPSDKLAKKAKRKSDGDGEPAKPKKKKRKEPAA
ncbi:hypothetical protein HDZ31DRAFT_44084 [Schizophyllum fasciatum]